MMTSFSPIIKSSGVDANDPYIARAVKPIGALMRRRSTKGLIGIELEVEGNKFPKTSGSTPTNSRIPKQWQYTKDGSLRGVDNAEYVLREPIAFEEVPKAVKDLWEMFDKYGSVLDESNRTSVHVHLNFQHLYLNNLASFIAMYVSLEDILTNYCGDHRVGNLFCLRVKDAPGILTTACKFIKSSASTDIRDSMHYAGMNLRSLVKFGSVEIRAMRGVTKQDDLLEWVSILERLYKLATTPEFNDPRSVCDQFSGGGGAVEYFNSLLGPLAGVVREKCGMSQQEFMNSLYEGIRYAQDICYCRDWNAVFEAFKNSGKPRSDADKLATFIEMYGAPGITMPAPSFNNPWLSAYPNSPNDEQPLYTAPFDPESDGVQF